MTRLDGFAVRVRLPTDRQDANALGHLDEHAHLRAFERARVAYFERMGVELRAVVPIVASTTCRYHERVRPPDVMEVGVRVPVLRGDRIPLEYAIRSEALGRVVARGEQILAAYDCEQDRMVELPASWREAIEALQSEDAEVPEAPRGTALEPDGRGFLAREGPAKRRGQEPCHKKLCFTATRLAPLRGLLEDLVARDDCWFVKVDAEPGLHGMYRGRCFLTDPDAVAALWRRHKVHDDYLCTIQDDDFTLGHR